MGLCCVRELKVINRLPLLVQMFQKDQVDPIQVKLQQVNGLGQGLIQSAGKNCDVQGLEHDMEEINTRWNTLNKKVSTAAEVRLPCLTEGVVSHCLGAGESAGIKGTASIVKQSH